MEANSDPDFIECTEAIYWIAKGERVNAETAKQRLTSDTGARDTWGTKQTDGLVLWLSHAVEKTTLPEVMSRSARDHFRDLCKRLKKDRGVKDAELLGQLREWLDTKQREADEEQGKLDEAEGGVLRAARAGKIEIWGRPKERDATNAEPGELEVVPLKFLLEPCSVHLPYNSLTVSNSASRAQMWAWRRDYLDLKVSFDDVKRLWPVSETAESTQLVEQPQGPRVPAPTTLAAPRGRRPKYDWEAFHIEIARRVGKDPDGLPEVQADLEKAMADWCLMTWGPEGLPAESTIRLQVTRHYRHQ
jgi:hypothetical protein